MGDGSLEDFCCVFVQLFCIVCIEVLRDRSARMAETSGNTFRGCAVLNQNCGVRVPEGVRVQSFLAKFPTQGIDRDEGAVFFCADRLLALHIGGRRQFF